MGGLGRLGRMGKLRGLGGLGRLENWEVWEIGGLLLSLRHNLYYLIKSINLILSLLLPVLGSLLPQSFMRQ